MFPLRGYTVPGPLCRQTNTNKVTMPTGMFFVSCSIPFSRSKASLPFSILWGKCHSFHLLLTGKTWKGASIVAFFLPLVTVHGLGEWLDIYLNTAFYCGVLCYGTVRSRR